MMVPLLVFGFRAVKGVTNRVLLVAGAALVLAASFQTLQQRFALKVIGHAPMSVMFPSLRWSNNSSKMWSSSTGS